MNTEQQANLLLNMMESVTDLANLYETHGKVFAARALRRARNELNHARINLGEPLHTTDYHASTIGKPCCKTPTGRQSAPTITPQPPNKNAS